MTSTNSSAGRNDPCPCGSGKKYKKCCLLAADGAPGASRSIATHVTPRTRRAAKASGVWEADIVPLPIALADDPHARPAAVLVIADGLVLASEVLGRAPSEPDDIAVVLEGAVRSVGTAMDGWPETVEVRHAAVGEALAPRLTDEGVPVVARRHLDDLDDAASHLIGEVGPPGRGVLLSSTVETWTAWGLPPDRVAELFEAAADLWRAEPWVRIPNPRRLTVEVPGGGEWAVSVLGYAGQEYGLALYSNPDDFASFLGASDAVAAFAGVEGRVLSLSFDSVGELPRAMRREVASAGWELAAPEACPVLMTTNTPAGGVSRRDAADLAAALRAVAALAREAPGALSAGERVERLEPHSGVRVVHHAADDTPIAGPWIPLWEPIGELAPAGPEGPGARPEAALELLDGGPLIERLAGPRLWELWKAAEARTPPERDAEPADGGGPPPEASGTGPSMGRDVAVQLRFGGGEWEEPSADPGPELPAGTDGDRWQDAAGEEGSAAEDEGDGPPAEGEAEASSSTAEVLDELDTAIHVAIDPFFWWLLDDRGLSLDTARKHARNAATFAAFLFGTGGVPLAAVTEYDLRHFLFEWYPRKAVDATYRVEAMPVSLGRFFAWLAEAEGIECPWARAVLAERDAYADRYYEFPGGPWWDEDVDEWAAELWEDLDRRVMLYDGGLGGTSEWGEQGPFGRVMGPAEARLEQELERRWLQWRDEEIRRGRTERDPLRAALVRRQRAWETSPHPGLDGLTPVEAIEREREERRAPAGE